MTGPAELPLLLTDGDASTSLTGQALPIPAPRRPQARRLAGPIRENGHRGDSAESPTLHVVPDQAESAVPLPPVTDLEATPVDRGAVRAIQERLSRTISREGRGSAPTSGEMDSVRARIHEAVLDHNNSLATAGSPLLSPQAQQALRVAVYNEMFSLGPLTPLLEQPGLNDLEIRAGGKIWCLFGDGRITTHPPLFDTDAELIEFITQLAAMGPTPRPFDRTHPYVDFALPDGSRASAQAFYTPYPMLTIRRHPLTDIDADEMVQRGAWSPSIAAFLTACMRAGKSVLFSGVAGSGKTVSARALLNTLPPTTALATIETEDELGLWRLEHRHGRVWAGQELIGGGEVVNGRVAGQVTIEEMIPQSLRANTQVIVVGEVRGREAITMLQAMQSGFCSVSTIHAHNGRDTIERLVTCVSMIGDYSTTWAYRQAASLIDVVVHIGYIDERHLGGKQHRFVDEIVLPRLSGDSPSGFSVPQLYRPGPDGRAIPDLALEPSWMPDLVRHGFDRSFLTPARGGWPEPMTTIIPTTREDLA